MATLSSAESSSQLHCVCLLAYNTATLLARLKAFLPQPPNCGKYCIDCISVTVPLEVATRRVVMDTTFHPDDHFTAPPTSSQAYITDEFKCPQFNDY